ncbi:MULTISPECIES: LysE family translocator [Colwellia]|uniref:Transporter, LysE family n=1 Tax=Colwellia psychrerythraea (strain 34H / ATCC BAA-681) TaxID=167879 RepID=Q481P5_COLP3|nr:MULTISPECIES: LysE family translocator [Colwellia]AAZ25007.1 transporter, LysE family [Colwellia psychrerythraea 34H]PKH87503.1 LysE family translocator [Colwellia sp. Bg11-28]
MDYLIAIVLFAISSSVTPGPNNITIMASGVNFGIRRSMPLFLGICVGFAVMLLLVGIGFGQIFEKIPTLHIFIKFIGTLYLLYLAFLIATADEITMSNTPAKPLTFMKGALFQWLNAKAWVVATGAIAAFTTVGVDFYTQNIIIALTFLVISFPCVGIWLFFGSTLKKRLKSKQHRKVFNYSMGGLLVISVIPVIKELSVQLTQ